MKRILTIVSVLSLLATGAMAADYGWSISGSSTDPNANVGTPAPGQVVQTYLWLDCVDPALGAAAMECQMTTTAPFAAGPFLALNGALATGAPDLLLAIGCATETILLGNQPYFDGGGGFQVCLAPSGANNKLVTVDCALVGALERPMAVRGFDSTGAGFCVIDECTVVSVEDASWGSIKGLYR